MSPDEVIAGDWAWHRSGLDPRLVRRVVPAAGGEPAKVWLDLAGAEMGPFRKDCYTYTRRVD